MAQPAPSEAPRPRPTRAARTRASILEAAETAFAARGFEGTRLEDVAFTVGIKRASIVYYFRDKRELYEAVLESVFGDFQARLEEALFGPGSFDERIEAGVSAWVDTVWRRPALARLLMREVAGATPERRPALLRFLAPFVSLVDRFRAQATPEVQARLAPVDPAHIASTVAGSTVFFVAFMPVLLPDGNFDPLRPEQLEAHRREVLRITRRLLGTGA